MARMPAMDGGGVDLLVPTFVWPLDRLGSGSQIVPGAAQFGDADVISFNSADSTPAVSARYASQAPIDSRFGRATFPQVAGTAPNRAPGLRFGTGLTNWMLATRAAGRAFWIAQAWKCPYSTPHRAADPNFQFSMFQDYHIVTLDQFGSMRVRSHLTTQIQTRMMENNGADTLNESVVTHQATTCDFLADPATYGPNIGFQDDNVVEVLIQATPNDPDLSSETHKHNMCVWFRTTAPDGSEFFAPALFTHYTPGSSGTNAWNTRIEEPVHIGRTIGENASGGYQGDMLGMAMGALPSGAMLTLSQATAAMNRLWSDVSQLDGWQNRGRGRAR